MNPTATRVAVTIGLAAMLCAACERTPNSADPAKVPDAAAGQAVQTTAEIGSPAAAEKLEAAPLRKDGTIFAEAELMGTRVTINVYVGPQRDAAAATQAVRDAFAELSRIESIASEWDPNTPLSGLNVHAGADPRSVPPELIEILARAREIAEATNGRFDPTVYVVGELWSFDPGSRPPSAAAIEARLPLVDWRGIEVDRDAGTARLARPGMKIGLGGIAKGYGVDAASAVLRDAGFTDHIVEAGGDTYASGDKAGGPWQIGVQRPHARGALGSIETRDEAIVTSGNYARYFEFDGRKYTHILDPTSGWPIAADNSPLSVTCRAPDATTADAFCTAFSVMGPDAAIAFAEARSDLDILIIGADGEIRLSNGFVSRFRAFDEPQP